jgi:hypothetical protein
VIDTFLVLLIGVGPKLALAPFVEITAALDPVAKRQVLRKMLGIAREQTPRRDADARIGLARGIGGQTVQTMRPVTVPDSENPGAGLAEIWQVTGPGAPGFAATCVSVPNGEVNVRSKLAGRNSPRWPSLRVTKAGFQVVP